MASRVFFPNNYALAADHSEPRQSTYAVFHDGKLVETFYSRTDALTFIAESVAAWIMTDPEEDE